MEREEIMNTCTCEAFRKAQESGTDNEGYSSLIRASDGEWSFGGGQLEPLRFCPWCGKPAPEVPAGI
jgi:hypothetical protein